LPLLQRLQQLLHAGDLRGLTGLDRLGQLEGAGLLPWASSVSAISIAPWWCTIINCRKSRSKSAPDAAVSC